MTPQMKRSTAQSAFDIQICYLAFVALLIGCAVRLWGIETHSLWTDEFNTLEIVSHDSLKNLFSEGIIPNRHNPPLYFVIEFFIVRSFGDSEIALRAFSVLCSIASIFAIFKLGERCYSRYEGMIASILVALLFFPIWYSHEARSYSLVFLLSIINFTQFIKLFVDQNHTKRVSIFDWFAYIFCLVLLIYTHYFAVFLMCAQGAYIVFFGNGTRKASIRSFILCSTLVFISFLPWLIIFIESSVAHSPNEFYKLTGGFFRSLYLLLLEFFNNSRLILSLTVGVFCLFVLDSLRVAATSNEVGLLTRQSSGKTILLGVWFLVPVVIVYALTKAGYYLFSSRYLIICAPPAYILAARGITYFSTRSPAAAISVPIILILILCGHLFLRIDYFSKPYKHQVREAVEHIVKNNPREGGSVVIGYAWGELTFDYYFERLNSDLRVDILAGEKEDIPALARLLSERTANYFWLIEAHRVVDEDLLQFMQDNFELVEEQEFHVASVRLFSKTSE